MRLKEKQQWFFFGLADFPGDNTPLIINLADEELAFVCYASIFHSNSKGLRLGKATENMKRHDKKICVQYQQELRSGECSVHRGTYSGFCHPSHNKKLYKQPQQKNNNLKIALLPQQSVHCLSQSILQEPDP